MLRHQVVLECARRVAVVPGAGENEAHGRRRLNEVTLLIGFGTAL
ncbi:MAG TPA: hypothetical protein VGA22_03120 [Gemmatimonadales bacterium]